MPKNFKKVPPHIVDRIKTIGLDDVIVATAKLIKLTDISKFQQLGLRVVDGVVTCPAPFIPPMQAGKFSRINVEGHEFKRIDLPKVAKEFCWESPNFGDWSKGSHMLCQTRDVWQLDFMSPKHNQLSIQVLENNGMTLLVKFAIDQTLNQRENNFEDDLLYNLNILQENVGDSNIFPAEATISDFKATIKLDWEILPVGTAVPIEEILRILGKRQGISKEDAAVIETRLEFFRKLKPTNYIAGSSGMARYFGAKFADDFVLFENVRYGNAIYIMYENWVELSKKNRYELLQGDRNGYERIEHRDGWESRVEAIILQFRRKQKRARR